MSSFLSDDSRAAAGSLWSGLLSFVVRKSCSLRRPDALIPCPTSVSFWYPAAVSMCLYPFFKANSTACSTWPGCDLHVPTSRDSEIRHETNTPLVLTKAQCGHSSSSVEGDRCCCRHIDGNSRIDKIPMTL